MGTPRLSALPSSAGPSPAPEPPAVLVALRVGSADLGGLGEALDADAEGDDVGEGLALDGDGVVYVGGAAALSVAGDTGGALVEVSGTAARTCFGGVPSRAGVS
jgi:hypothetical protein